jgi:hypothetical protein
MLSTRVGIMSRRLAGREPLGAKQVRGMVGTANIAGCDESNFQVYGTFVVFCRSIIGELFQGELSDGISSMTFSSHDLWAKETA